MFSSCEDRLNSREGMYSPDANQGLIARDGRPPSSPRIDRSTVSRKRYRIGDLLLDERTRTVRRGSEHIDLPRLSFRLLRALAEAAPDVLDYDAIATKVWCSRTVTPETVTQRVKLLRQALGDDARAPRYIGLARGEGYRLVADVEDADDECTDAQNPVSVPAHRRIRAIATLALLAVAAITTSTYLLSDSASSAAPHRPATSIDAKNQKSIAVLPFADLSHDGDLAFLGYGIADEVLHRLSQNPDVHVIARTSSFSLAERNVTVGQIATLLGVRYVLQGSVRRSEDAVRVTAQLVDAESGGHVWSRAYDIGRLGSIEVQKAIGFDLGRLLEVRVGPSRDRQRDVIPEAYERFMRTEFLFDRRADGDIERAIAGYRDVVRIDPDFARAWVGLAGALYIQLATNGEVDRAQSVAEQRYALERALALNPGLAEAYVRLGTFFERGGQWERAQQYFDRAWELNPRHPLILSIRAGRLWWDDLDESVRLQRRAVALNPLSATYRENLAGYLVMSDRLEEAETEIDRATALIPAAAASFAAHLAIIRLLQDRYPEALELAAGIDEPLLRDALVAMAQHALGQVRESTVALTRLEQMDQPMAIVHAAEVRAFTGDSDAVIAAIADLERLIPTTQEEFNQTAEAWMMLRFSPFLGIADDEYLRKHICDTVREVVSAGWASIES